MAASTSSRFAPQNSNISFNTRVHNFNAEQPVPLSHARGASNFGPSHAAALPALRLVLEPLETISADAAGKKQPKPQISKAELQVAHE